MAAPRHRSLASPLAGAWLALVLYASLFPFTGWRWPPGHSLYSLLRLPWPPWLDTFDLWANFAGYLPLGALLLIAARRSGWRPGAALAFACLLPSALSYATEVTQHFLPGRFPSLKDWAMNTLGAAAGAAVGWALLALGWVERWSRLRARWVERGSAGALALLALWPVGLLFPAPVPLGLGQVGPRLRETLVEGLAGVPWAAGLHDLLEAAPPSDPLWPPLEGVVTAFGLLAPCVVAFAVVPAGWRRAAAALAMLAAAVGGMTLSTLLNFGPPHAFAWLTAATMPALLAGLVVAFALVPLPARVVAGLGLALLGALVMLVAQAPADPYFAANLQAWEQGRWVRFHGAAQWVGWLWPYVAMVWLLARLAQPR